MAIAKDKQSPLGGEIHWLGAPGTFHSGIFGNEQLSLPSLAERLGVGWPILLYYELRGLTQRIRIGKARVYPAAEADRAAFIVKCRRIGLTLRDIGPIIDRSRSADRLEVARACCCVLIERLQQSLLDTDDMIGELERRYTALSSETSGGPDPAKWDQIPAAGH
jgi:DNA-binding transcriptional MerR regulator